MEVVTNLNCKKVKYKCIEDFIEKSHLSVFFNNIDGEVSLLFTSHQNRMFVYLDNEMLFISDNLKFFTLDFPMEISTEANCFYTKFGFILPPFTQYKNVYITAPFIRFTISSGSLDFKSEYPETTDLDDNIEIESVLTDYFNVYDKKSLNVLVSGGIDSSALLGFLNKDGKVSSTFMCKMSSLPTEGTLACKLSDSIGVPFSLIDLDLDLSHRANEFISESGEYISDSIALVFPELFSLINNTKKDEFYLVDGQGADSLLNGLPLNKIYNLWKKLFFVRGLLKPLSFLPIYKNRSTPLKRTIYRMTKAVNCLAQSDFRKSILVAMLETEGDMNLIEKHLLVELELLYKHFNDWHLVIRFLYMFRVLPAREMQKYLLAKKYNIIMVAPFLDEKVVKALFFLSNESTIKDGLYKYPITKLAQKYWPNNFKKSKTSPFQVNYSVGCGDLKDYSLNRAVNKSS